MSKLLQSLSKVGSTKNSVTLSESKYFGAEETATTKVPILNMALSGSIDGGLQPGLTVIAGRSKSFKSTLSLVCVAAYLDKYPDAVCMFYDTEFGASKEYFEAAGVDSTRVLHIPVINVEELKFDVVAKLEEIKKGDKVVFLIDSIGNIASKKEVDDAKEQSSKTDMSRAKSIKSLFRLVTPYLTLKQLPMIAINHVYASMSLYGGDEMSGGCLVEGTNIIMADDSFKEIQDVQKGELVKTLLGDREVTHTWNPETLSEGTPECIKITFEDGTHVVCSDNHKFLMDEQWEEASSLCKGDELSEL